MQFCRTYPKLNMCGMRWKGGCTTSQIHPTIHPIIFNTWPGLWMRSGMISHNISWHSWSNNWGVLFIGCIQAGEGHALNVEKRQQSANSKIWHFDFDSMLFKNEKSHSNAVFCHFFFNHRCVQGSKFEFSNLSRFFMIELLRVHSYFWRAVYMGLARNIWRL